MLPSKHLLAWYLKTERNLEPCARVRFKVQCAAACAASLKQQAADIKFTLCVNSTDA